MSQGNTLVCYRGMEEGETGLDWIVREGTVERASKERKVRYISSEEEEIRGKRVEDY